jgi:hypothetical protein
MSPHCRALIVLVECGLVMCDKDKWKDRSVWLWEFITIVVPFVEAMFILFPPVDKFLSVFHNIFALMPINIHSVFCFAISPAKLSKPAPYRAFRDRGFVYPFLPQNHLEFWTCNNINNIRCFHKMSLCLLCEFELDFSCDIFIF